MSMIYVVDHILIYIYRSYIYRGRDCMKKLCESLKQFAMEVINFEKKKMMPLTNKKLESYTSQENCKKAVIRLIR